MFRPAASVRSELSGRSIDHTLQQPRPYVARCSFLRGVVPDGGHVGLLLLGRSEPALHQDVAAGPETVGFLTIS
jgi:hypothetical protein